MKLLGKFKRQKEEFEKWENSIEGVLDSLKTHGVGYSPEDKKNTVVIAKTLLRLPRKVREKVLAEAHFIFTNAMGTVDFAYFPVIVKKDDLKPLGKDAYAIGTVVPLIILNFRKREKESAKMDTIAHEIAHFVLEKPHSNVLPEGAKIHINEKRADDLVEKWGFKRAYRSYELGNLQLNY